MIFFIYVSVYQPDFKWRADQTLNEGFWLQVINFVYCLMLLAENLQPNTSDSHAYQLRHFPMLIRLTCEVFKLKYIKYS
jgi:hypothetical protein